MSFLEAAPVKLSIVIAAWTGPESLRDCLSSLKNQVTAATGTEVIVVSNFEIGMNKLAAEFPFADYLILPPETIVPLLRTRGILRSKGTIIALSEDLCIFHEKWGAAIIGAHESEHSIIGSAVENTTHQKLLDWAVYFYDYGKYALPKRMQTVDTLSGINVSYKQAVLQQMKPSYAEGFFEAFIHEELKRRGYSLYLVPSAIIFHHKNYEFKQTARLFYHQARSFAARRVFGFPASKKNLYAAATLLLPVWLSLRIVSRTIAAGRNLKKLGLALPYIIALMSVWSFGEFCGYLGGEGTSAGKWK